MIFNLTVSSLIKSISFTEKLNNTNYDSYAFKFEMLLIKEDLFKYVTEGTPDKLDDTLLKNNANTCAKINSCIADNQIVHVKNLQNEKDIWETLKRIYQPVTCSF